MQRRARPRSTRSIVRGRRRRGGDPLARGGGRRL